MAAENFLELTNFHIIYLIAIRHLPIKSCSHQIKLQYKVCMLSGSIHFSIIRISNIGGEKPRVHIQ